ncbi:MAG: hypothetical protein EXR69_00890 [Myxococcales bacterium]|nr:hypothetical protein [Myxococcales bacterium]
MPRKSTHKLDSFLPRLGKEPDHKIANEAGVSRSLVISFRKKHNIAAYEGYKFGADNPPPAARAAAAKAPQAAQKKPGPTARAKAPQAAPPRAPSVKPAPSAPAPAQAESAADAGFRGRKSALDAYVEMLGKLPDAEIAKLAHVTPENVRTYRTRRHIAADWPEASKARVGRPRGQTSRPAAAPPAPVAVAPARVAEAPAPKVAPPKVAPVVSEARSIFSVSVDIGGSMRTYAVAASNINDGVVSANALVQRRHPNGIVKSISFVAELLG